MNEMFFDCESLTTIDLSNFNTNNIKGSSYILAGCGSLKKEGIIAKDKQIFIDFELQNHYYLSYENN